jgi:hypothetical protein
MDEWLVANSNMIDRSLKEIGIVDAAPVYEPLNGFQRYVEAVECIKLMQCARLCIQFIIKAIQDSNQDTDTLDSTIDLVAICDVALTRLAADISPGHLQRGENDS